MYIGNVSPRQEKIWLYTADKVFEERKVLFCAGLAKIIDEILQNARDHVIREKECDQIRIYREGPLIKIYNNGNGIPVMKHK
jgi:DNA gyrase/topoisomerase IV subunit B